MHLILTGATGTVGSSVLNYCLERPSITNVTILSRRPVPLASVHPKAEVIIHTDYTEYPPSVIEKLKGATGCVWAQGVSQNDVGKEYVFQSTSCYT